MTVVRPVLSLDHISKRLFELNRNCARYKVFLLLMGTQGDCLELRLQVKFFKKRILDEAQSAHDYLVTYQKYLLMGEIVHCQTEAEIQLEKENLERLQAFMIAIFEFLISSLTKAGRLTESHTNHNLINCGIQLPSAIERSSLRVETRDPAHSELQISADIDNIHQMISDLYHIGGLNPWTIQPTADFFIESLRLSLEQKHNLRAKLVSKRASINNFFRNTWNRKPSIDPPRIIEPIAQSFHDFDKTNHRFRQDSIIESDDSSIFTDTEGTMTRLAGIELDATTDASEVMQSIIVDQQEPHYVEVAKTRNGRFACCSDFLLF
ncbi:hypothetical protein Ciccas_005678 [Cichlidogyrus casuarinus]|uniref:Uncharacterized protein n=1 Tax=Cichlidogyrus casuarinus TaxID=1844966 RepID=A0ABD2QBM0_9PLAT